MPESTESLIHRHLETSLPTPPPDATTIYSRAHNRRRRNQSMGALMVALLLVGTAGIYFSQEREGSSNVATEAPEPVTVPPDDFRAVLPTTEWVVINQPGLDEAVRVGFASAGSPADVMVVISGDDGDSQTLQWEGSSATRTTDNDAVESVDLSGTGNEKTLPLTDSRRIVGDLLIPSGSTIELRFDGNELIIASGDNWSYTLTPIDQTPEEELSPTTTS